MENKLFYVDSSIGLRRSYDDLLQDAALITQIPNAYWSKNIYDLLTVLVAAICNDASLALTPNDSMEIQGVQRISSSSITGLSKLQSKITNSCCRLGVFTSGSTGRPKLIEHSIETLTRFVRRSDKHRDDIWGLVYHPSSFAGLQVFFQAIFNGNPLVRLLGLDAPSIHHAIECQGVTHISSTPTMMRLLCSDEVVHRRVRYITTGGEITERSLISRVQLTFPNARFRNIYASTESGSLLISDDDLFRVPDHLTDRIKVLDGQLAVHRSLLAESLRTDDQLDFFLTGDCVEVLSNEPLVLRFIARRDDWINVGGFKMNPKEIEIELLEIDGIAEARVFGRKNPVTGNIVCCEIVLAPGMQVTPAMIRKQLQGRLPSYKIPRVIDFLNRSV